MNVARSDNKLARTPVVQSFDFGEFASSTDSRSSSAPMGSSRMRSTRTIGTTAWNTPDGDR